MFKYRVYFNVMFSQGGRSNAITFLFRSRKGFYVSDFFGMLDTSLSKNCFLDFKWDLLDNETAFVEITSDEELHEKDKSVIKSWLIKITSHTYPFSMKYDSIGSEYQKDVATREDFFFFKNSDYSFVNTINN